MKTKKTAAPKTTTPEKIDTTAGTPDKDSKKLGGASLISEKKKYICQAREACGMAAEKCKHAVPHEHNEIHGCSNGAWCPSLIELSKLGSKKGEDAYMSLTEAMGDMPKPICVEHKEEE